MSTRRDVRIGLLGTGAVAQIVHLPVLSELPGARLAAVCDVEHAKAASIARRFGIDRVHRRDADVIADDGVDAVIVCTPSHLHEAQAIAALEAGKHVLVERPLALDAAGAQRVVDAAERAGRVLMVALNNRFRADVLAVKPYLSGGELGEPFAIRAGWLNRKVHALRPTWRHRRETAGGGALMDLGTQVLDLCLWLLDHPRVERVSAHVHPGEAMEVEDTASVLLRLAGDASLSVEVSWSLLAQRDRHYLRVLGTRGSASVSPLAVYKEIEHGILDVTPQVAQGRENAYTASYRQELLYFLDAARGGHPVEPPREQVELMRLIGLAYRSAEEGREVEA